MTRATFYERDGSLTGFRVVGHSTDSAADDAGRLVCAAVSSAVYLAANTLTEIVGAPAEISVDEAELSLVLTGSLAEGQPILRGLRLHLQQLQTQYSKQLQVFSEVSESC